MIKITQGAKIHIPAIIKIWKEFLDFHKKRDSFFTRRKDAHIYFEKYLKKFMLSRKSKVFVAYSGNKILGFIMVKIEKYPPVFKIEKYGYIETVAVAKKYRRSGVGQMLLDESEKWFIDKKISHIELKTSVKNEVATSFWKKHGFKEYIHLMSKNL